MNNTEDFCLEDKVIGIPNPIGFNYEDVKEFIRRLKFKLCNQEWCEDWKFNERWIDKLAGKTLAGGEDV